MKANRRVGRPKNAVSRINWASASTSMVALTEQRDAIMSVIDDAEFSAYFRKLVLQKKLELSKQLASEFAFFPALDNTLARVPVKRRGPRPKWALSLFVTQVRQKLLRAGVVLPQWKKGAQSSGLTSQRTDLQDFCRALVKATASTRMHVSSRTVNNAPKEGFSNGSF
ncbi:MAG: hypothetical protein Q8M87_06375 [Rhodoferax sp.]|nr:hypothetical protein [Rhodoferax sp.]